MVEKTEQHAEESVRPRLEQEVVQRWSSPCKDARGVTSRRWGHSLKQTNTRHSHAHLRTEGMDEDLREMRQGTGTRSLGDHLLASLTLRLKALSLSRPAMAALTLASPPSSDAPTRERGATLKPPAIGCGMLTLRLELSICD